MYNDSTVHKIQIVLQCIKLFDQPHPLSLIRNNEKNIDKGKFFRAVIVHTINLQIICPEFTCIFVQHAFLALEY